MCFIFELISGGSCGNGSYAGLQGWRDFLPRAVWHLSLPKFYESPWFHTSFNFSVSARFLSCEGIHIPAIDLMFIFLVGAYLL